MHMARKQTTQADLFETAPGPAIDVFDLFWQRYPRRVGKGDARKAWEKAIKKVEPAVILVAVVEFAKSPKGRAGQYCPHPSTWLNQERWDDDRSEWQRGDNEQAGSVGHKSAAEIAMEADPYERR